MKDYRYSAFALAAFAALTLACGDSDNGPDVPLTPTSGGVEAAADGSTLKVTAPRTVSPTGGAEVTDLDPDLVIDNAAPKFVSNLALSYVFEVIDSQNRVVYRSVPVPEGDGGRTSHGIDGDLSSNETHTWRAYAVYEGRSGPVSAAASFRTFDRFGVSCADRGGELAIIECRKAQYGHIEHDQLPEFLERVAHDLNRAGAEHRPYGRLIKDFGNNCHGFACDIICSGNGGGQRQWDVLEDEDAKQGPQWSRVGEPSIRPCAFVE